MGAGVVVMTTSGPQPSRLIAGGNPPSRPGGSPTGHSAGQPIARPAARPAGQRLSPEAAGPPKGPTRPVSRPPGPPLGPPVSGSARRRLERERGAGAFEVGHGDAIAVGVGDLVGGIDLDLVLPEALLERVVGEQPAHE